MCTGKYCPKSQYQPSLLGWLVLMPREYSPIHIEKTVIIVFVDRICLKLTKEKLDTNRTDLKTRKNDVIFQWLHFPGVQLHIGMWPCSF